jgi:Mg/Co/Ni transporter MgtE
MNVEYVFNQQQMQEIVNHLKQLPFGDVNEIMAEIKRQDDELSKKIQAEYEEKESGRKVTLEGEVLAAGSPLPPTKEVQ